MQGSHSGLSRQQIGFYHGAGYFPPRFLFRPGLAAGLAGVAGRFGTAPSIMSAIQPSAPARLAYNPIDLCRYQVANCFMGRMGLINSGGASGKDDLRQAVRTAVINKRAGGMGLISGRKAFQKPLPEGVQLLNAIQDVYLDKSVTVA